MRYRFELSNGLARGLQLFSVELRIVEICTIAQKGDILHLNSSSSLPRSIDSLRCFILCSPCVTHSIRPVMTSSGGNESNRD